MPLMCELSLSSYIYLTCLLKRKFLLYGISFVFCQAIKPTILIGTSGQGRTFTKEVVEAMASLNEVYCKIFCYWKKKIAFANEEANSTFLCMTACRNPLFFLFPTQLHSLNAPQKKPIRGAR